MRETSFNLAAVGMARHSTHPQGQGKYVFSVGSRASMHSGHSFSSCTPCRPRMFAVTCAQIANQQCKHVRCRQANVPPMLTSRRVPAPIAAGRPTTPPRCSAGQGGGTPGVSPAPPSANALAGKYHFPVGRAIVRLQCSGAARQRASKRLAVGRSGSICPYNIFINTCSSAPTEPACTLTLHQDFAGSLT